MSILYTNDLLSHACMLHTYIQAAVSDWPCMECQCVYWGKINVQQTLSQLHCGTTVTIVLPAIKK